MTAPATEHIQAALAVLSCGFPLDVGEPAPAGLIAYHPSDITEIESRLRRLLDAPTKDRAQLQLLPPRRHSLSRKHHAAVKALAVDSLTDDELRAVIGTYATNVIKSLVSRELIRLGTDEGLCSFVGRWWLTEKGWDLYRELTKTPR